MTSPTGSPTRPAPPPAARIAGSVAVGVIADVGGLKLFGLMGFYQPQDDRLARAPGRLTGVIGAAPEPLDA